MSPRMTNSLRCRSMASPPGSANWQTAYRPLTWISCAGSGLYHTAGAYLFVHAGMRPGVPLAAQNAHDLLWIREPFLSSTVEHGMIVVHGHTIFPEVSITPNRIGIDTGAVATDRLSCLVLEGHDRRLLHT